VLPVRILIHALPDAPEIPTGDIARLYATADVDLTFQQASALETDPERWLEYLRILRELAPTRPPPGSPAHLFVGRRWLGPGLDETNGMLLSRERGGIAIFTGSNDLSSGSADALLQTCAHEIAHLLNLTHALGDGNLPTIECPASVRAGRDVATAWRAFDGEHDAQRAFPLSVDSIAALRTRSRDSVLPWGADFDDMAGAEDAAPTLRRVTT
jgi:hypothetical protein